MNLFLQPTQDITVGGRITRGSFQYTLQDPNFAELTEWSQRMLDKMRTLPELADASTDLLANAPQLKVSINREQASRFGISRADDRRHAQRRLRPAADHPVFHAAQHLWVIQEITPELQAHSTSLDRLYIKSPLTGAAVPMSSLVNFDSRRSDRWRSIASIAVSGGHAHFQPAPGVALGQAVDAISKAAQEIGMPASVIATFQGNAQAFQTSLSSEPALIAAALVVVYIILGMLYESFIHPLTILSTLPSAGIGALLALSLGHMDLSVIGIIGIILLIGIVKKNGIMLVDFAITAERDRNMAPIAAIREACLLRFRPILMTTAAAMLAGVPLALGNGTGAELRQPLGYAMVGGLALSQLLTLYTTPVVYLYLDRLHRWLGRGKRGPVIEAERIHVAAAE